MEVFKYQTIRHHQPCQYYGYGLEPEKAWNFGMNFIHNFRLNGRQGSISLDATTLNLKIRRW
ncbi:MAG: hypothetical protein IPH58_16660 [Sphingobacteriales bacterium]|nr:hypothetical protein [Sphingobacteriales bacterium]